MSERYSWYFKALELGKGRELTRDHMLELGVSETDPKPGFYRSRAFKGGPYLPVAIWHDGQGLICLRGATLVEEIGTAWTWCSRWPISEQLYRSVAAGGPWPDEPPAPPIGHNQPAKTGDPCLDLQSEFKAEFETAKDFLKKPVETQEQADQIAVWSKKVGGILKTANHTFTVEKKPWLDGGKKVDDRWRWRQDCESLAKSLKRHLDGWLHELDRRERERQRKAREEADRLRRQAEEAARSVQILQQETGLDSLFTDESKREADRLAEQAAGAEREALARKASAGRTGAKVSLHTYQVAKITNYDTLLMALKNEPEIREAVEKIASRIARAKGAPLPPGMERVEEKRAA